MKQIDTEEVVIASCLAVGWALITITRHLLAPMAGLALALLGWRPGPSPDCVLDGNGVALAKLADPRLGVPWDESDTGVPLLPHIAITCQSRTFSSRDVLRVAHIKALRRLADQLGICHIGITKPDLIEAILNATVDRENNYSSEVPTAEERSPSLARRTQA